MTSQGERTSIAAETTEDMIRELGADVCLAYSICFEKIGQLRLKQRGFDPRTLIILNLELRSVGLPAGGLYLSGDGFGNYWFVAAADRRGKVALWSHDPPGIEPTKWHLLEFLQVQEQESPISTEAPPGDVYISRTKVPGESILDPITLREWVDVVKQVPCMRFLGYKPGRNPFTGEQMRFNSPGGALARHNEREIFFQLVFGRVRAERVGADTAVLMQQLAGLLSCHVSYGT
jgi:hypothetical protein